MYLVTAAAASVLSYILVPEDAVGASGAIFGLFGVLGTTLWFYRPMMPRARGLAQQIAILVIINLVLDVGLDAGGVGIDIFAHIGGLLAGIWLGLVIAPRGVQTLGGAFRRPGDDDDAQPRPGAGPPVGGRHRPRRRHRRRPGPGHRAAGGLTRMSRSLAACFAGTFTLRFSTGLTGALLGFYLAHLADLGGTNIDAFVVGLMSAGFYLSELVLATPFGILSDRVGHHRVMQAGPVFGFAAAVLTGLSRFVATAAAPLLVPVLTVTRALEGTSTAASVPSILGYVAAATAGNEALRGRSAALFETATLGGLGAGFVVAPKLFEAIGTTAFFLNAVVYVVSLLIFRFGVSDPRADAVGGGAQGGRLAALRQAAGQRRGAPPGADLDRRQRRHRAVVQPVDLPVRAARRPLPQPAPPSRLRPDPDHRRRDRHHGHLRGRPVLLGRSLQEPPAQHDHPLRRHRRRRRGRQLPRHQPQRGHAAGPADRLRRRRRGGPVRARRAPPPRRSVCWPTSPAASPTIAARSWASTASSWPSARSWAAWWAAWPPRCAASTACSWPRSLMLAIALLPLFRLRSLEHLLGPGDA